MLNFMPGILEQGLHECNGEMNAAFAVDMRDEPH
jgi:hypothetical protein